MLASKFFRPTKEGMGDDEIAYSYGGSPGRAMRDLVEAKIAVSVCDGCFVENPIKDYLC